ncbi:hypothetical protein ACF07B_34165 [Streptomyces sp. NPDC015532]
MTEPTLHCAVHVGWLAEFSETYGGGQALGTIAPITTIVAAGAPSARRSR